MKKAKHHSVDTTAAATATMTTMTTETINNNNNQIEKKNARLAFTVLTYLRISYRPPVLPLFPYSIASSSSPVLTRVDAIVDSTNFRPMEILFLPLFAERRRRRQQRKIMRVKIIVDNTRLIYTASVPLCVCARALRSRCHQNHARSHGDIWPTPNRTNEYWFCRRFRFSTDNELNFKYNATR